MSAVRSGAASTPSFFINGEPYGGRFDDGPLIDALRFVARARAPHVMHHEASHRSFINLGRTALGWRCIGTGPSCWQGAPGGIPMGQLKVHNKQLTLPGATKDAVKALPAFVCQRR